MRSGRYSLESDSFSRYRLCYSIRLFRLPKLVVSLFEHNTSIFALKCQGETLCLTLHPVSITRFPLRRFSPGADLLRYVFFIDSG